MDDNTKDTRTRITRTPEEFRGQIIGFRVARYEADELYRFCRARKMTMSYLIREALHKQYPELFVVGNRHIRKPRKPKPIEPRTLIMHSLANGTTTLLQTEPKPIKENES